MKLLRYTNSLVQPRLAWLTTALAGVVVPFLALLMLLGTSSPLTAPLPALWGSASGPILTLGLMGVGILGAAITRQFRVGVLFALLNGVCLIALVLAQGIPPLLHPSSVGLAILIASLSFAARGALFAKSLAGKAWLMAAFVVAGEGAVLLIAFAMPGALPDWFLALLPAQWASLSIQTALTGTGTFAAIVPLLALGGTAATTLLAARLWQRGWPYLLMFTAWLGLSAFVYMSVYTA